MINRLIKKLFFKTSTGPAQKLNTPRHIAVIMDGNGRWAQKRKLPRAAGHRVGLESIRAAIKTCARLDVKYLTVYAFSTENWSRPKEEVSFLMGLILESIDREINELIGKGVKVRFLGRLGGIEKKIREKIEAAVEKTKNNTGLNFQIMLNYGGRAEITDAVNKILGSAKHGLTVDEEMITDNLYTAGIPDPDLLIRTGGEHRISNFLLWEIAYSEIYVTKTLWPDFREKELIKAVEDFSSRNRRFGGL
ncbi:MAG: isoprenyl transferase [Candidatus Margulisiibacteriota bacterium]